MILEKITLITLLIIAMTICGGGLLFFIINDLLKKEKKNSSTGKKILAFIITLALTSFMWSWTPGWDRLFNNSGNSVSSTSSNTSSFVEFLMLFGVIFLLGWFWHWWTNLDFSLKKVKTFFRNQSNINKQSILEEPTVASKEVIQKDDDIYSQEVKLINKAIAEGLTIEFINDGNYNETIIKPIEITSGSNGHIVNGTWMTISDYMQDKPFISSEKNNYSFLLRKMSNIRILN